jgi:hypothetical protein
MDTYYTGTTLECALNIFEKGYFLTEPPDRVWKEHSQEYIYLVHSESSNGEAHKNIAEQSAYTLYQFSHTKRVIFELENLDSSLMEDDPDAIGIEAVRYPFDIPISNIKSIYVERRDNSRKIRKLMALSSLFGEEKWRNCDFWNLYEQCDFSMKYLYQRIGIKDINLIPKKYMLNEDYDLENYYMELMEFHNVIELFKQMTPQQFIKKYLYASKTEVVGA